ncbi:MAG: sulfite exporter TauE/SafE family protein [Bacteroidota bacterium]|nr:sulfite exporter TauE/SafE family protein [Bacteroidota bacterium]MEC8402536.1 sulfite exporter TauE/SafE family protein [Bacteroidota bacterium]
MLLQTTVPYLSLAFMIAFSAALLLGIAKSGIKGLAILIVTGLALVYGAKESTGILMPLLICGDILAVIYYKRHVKWVYLIKLLPWMVAGVLVGVVFGKDLPEDLFKSGMAVIILISVAMMYYWERKKDRKVPNHLSFAALMGMMAGFTTMVGNLAGVFSNIYFLAIKLPKNEFIGTAAWLFFIINLFKVPFHIWSWGTINPASFQISLSLIPAVILGFLFGVSIVKKIKNDRYRQLILLLTGLGGLTIFFQ